MVDLKSWLLGVAFMVAWNFITQPRPDVTAERIAVAQCVVESFFIVYLRVPRPVARWIATHTPYSLLPL